MIISLFCSSANNIRTDHLTLKVSKILTFTISFFRPVDPTLSGFASICSAFLSARTRFYCFLTFLCDLATVFTVVILLRAIWCHCLFGACSKRRKMAREKQRAETIISFTFFRVFFIDFTLNRLCNRATVMIRDYFSRSRCLRRRRRH